MNRPSLDCEIIHFWSLDLPVIESENDRPALPAPPPRPTTPAPPGMAMLCFTSLVPSAS